MILRPDSRESGVEFAVGAFLFALGAGLLIPRPGAGLWTAIQAGGNGAVWSVWLIGSSLFLIVGSYFRGPLMRLIAVIIAMCCWTALGFRFVEASLWGATIQSVVAILMLNACSFRLYRYMRDKNDRRAI